MKHNGGFTLIELMVTIAVMAIFMGVVLPNTVTFINSTRLTSNINSLMSDFMLARTEASSRGVRVVVCPAVAAAACSTDAGDWSTGRLIFADVNADGLFDTGDTAIKYVGEISKVAFTLTGFPNSLAITFSLTSGSDSSGRQLKMDISGRPITSRINTCS